MIFKKLFPILFCLSSTAFGAPLKVVCTLPDLAEMVKAIGGSEVEVHTLLKGDTDPHFADASPSYVLAVAKADAVVAIGLDLEIGWLPKVLERSNNSKVQAGTSGYIEAGSLIDVLDKVSGSVDRAMGDVHIHGNPHFNLSPLALAQSALALAKKLAQLKPENEKVFLSGAQSFNEKMQSLHKEIQNLLSPVRGQKFIEYHKEFTYFFNVYQLVTIGSIEEKPGSPPSAGRLHTISAEANKQNVQLALAANHSPEKHLKRFKELSGISYAISPSYVANNSTIADLQRALAKQIIQKLK